MLYCKIQRCSLCEAKFRPRLAVTSHGTDYNINWKPRSLGGGGLKASGSEAPFTGCIQLLDVWSFPYNRCDMESHLQPSKLEKEVTNLSEFTHQ